MTDPQASLTGNSSVSAVSALWKVLFEPRATFEALRESKPWILPVVLVALAFFAFTYASWPYIIDQQMEAFRTNENLPPEARERALEQMQGMRDEPSLVRVTLSPIFVIVGLLIAAGVWLMVGNVALGGNATYPQVWSVLSYANMAMVVEIVVKSFLVQMKQSMEVYTSLALIAPGMETGSFAFRALDAVDVFSVWFYVLMGIGLSAVCKVRAQKAMVASFVVWAVWAIGIKAGLGSMFGGLFGM